MFLILKVGSKEAKYNFIALEGNVAIEHNTLDPYHTVYLLGDDGTYGRYTREPRIRKELEKYIKQKTTIKILGSKGNDFIFIFRVILFNSTYIGGSKYGIYNKRLFLYTCNPGPMSHQFVNALINLKT